MGGDGEQRRARRGDVSSKLEAEEEDREEAMTEGRKSNGGCNMAAPHSCQDDSASGA